MDAGLFIAIRSDAKTPEQWQADADESAMSVLKNIGTGFMTRRMFPDYVWRMIPFRPSQFVSYLVKNEILDMMEREANSAAEEGTEVTRALWLSLRSILQSSDAWILLFLWKWDQIDVIEAVSVDEALSALSWNLSDDRGGIPKQGLLMYSASASIPTMRSLSRP